MAEMYSFSWKIHNGMLLSFVEDLLEDTTFADCTLAAAGHHINAHRVVLSSCSPYLKMLFCEENDHHPIIIFQDVDFRDLKDVVDFMYKGEIQIPEERVGSVLEIAQILQIRGMCNIKEIGECVNITKLSTKSENVPSLPKTSLRRDALDTSEGNIEDCIVFPLDKFPNCEINLSDQIPEIHLPESDDLSLPLPSPFNEASSSSLFLSNLDTDFLNECEKHFEAHTLDNPEDKKNLVDVAQPPVSDEAACEFREEILRNTSCKPMDMPTSQPCENLFLDFDSPVKISLSSEFDLGSLTETEEKLDTKLDAKHDIKLDTDLDSNLDRSLNTPVPWKHLQSFEDIVEDAISKEAADEVGSEEGSIHHSSTISTILPGLDLDTDTQSFADILKACEGDFLDDVNEEDVNAEGSRNDLEYLEESAVDDPMPLICDNAAGERRLAELLEEPPVARAAGGQINISALGKTSLSVTPVPCRIDTNLETKPYDCHVCNKRFFYQSHFDTHMRSHTGEKPFQCSVCHKRFSLKWSLNNHITLHQEEKPFPCPKCKKSFSVKSYLTKHLRYHAGEKPCQCSICGRSFAVKAHYQTHMRWHARKNNVPCSICIKRFSQLDARALTEENGFSILRQVDHVCSHSGEKRHYCSVCRKGYLSRAKLDVHMRSHTGEKPFHCTLCEKKFPRKDMLVCHMRSHTRKKLFQCCICEKQFSKKGYLAHMVICTRAKSPSSDQESESVDSKA